MFINLNKKWRWVIDILMIVVGTFVMGFAFSVFLEPNNISTGGFSGLSMIIKSILVKMGINFLSSSVIYLILNVGLFVLSLKVIGKSFAIKALIGIVSYSLAMEIFALLPINIQYETIISALYGGIFMGIGLGIVIRFGGSTGGSDMIACLFKNKYEKISVGKVVAIVDIIVVALSLFAFSNGLELLPYTIIAIFLSSNTTDFINEGYKQIKAYNIITYNPDQLAEEIMNKLNRGCTVQRAKGMHLKDEKSMLICLVEKYQIAELRRIIREVDPRAFVYSMPVSEVIGEWYKTNECTKNDKKNNKNSD